MANVRSCKAKAAPKKKKKTAKNKISTTKQENRVASSTDTTTKTTTTTAADVTNNASPPTNLTPQWLYGKRYIARNTTATTINGGGAGKAQNKADVCAGCEGKHNTKYAKDSILICNGQGCNRMYHSSCIPYPTVAIKPKSSPSSSPSSEKQTQQNFYCFDCDPNGGTSYHLSHYFDTMDDLRVEFIHLLKNCSKYHAYDIKNTKTAITTTDDFYNEEYISFLILLNGKGWDFVCEMLRNQRKRKVPKMFFEDCLINLRDLTMVIVPTIGSELDENSDDDDSDVNNKHEDKDVDQENQVLTFSEYIKHDQDENIPAFLESELCDILRLHNTAIDDSILSSKVSLKSSTSSSTPLSRSTEVTTPSSTPLNANQLSSTLGSTPATVTSTSATPQMKANLEQEEEKQKRQQQQLLTKYGPELLVGKIIRLYCPIDNQYHIGRIIDWRRCSTPYKTLRPQSLSSSSSLRSIDTIINNEFLLRFSKGLNGRKQTITKWISLEEHSCAVSVSMIMAHHDRGRGINGWKPAQSVLRTSIELVPVKHLIYKPPKSITKKQAWALVIFFGDEKTEYTHLDIETVDLFSPHFDQMRMTKQQLLLSEQEKTTEQHHQSTKSQIAFSSYIHNLAEVMDLTMNLVKIELEEQKRIFDWHKLNCHNMAHEKCLSMRDEISLPPLEIQHRTVPDMNVDDESMPNLCPLIQKGIDRQWLMNQIISSSPMKVEKDKERNEVQVSLDIMASLSFSISSPISMKMAQLKAQR